MKTLKLCSFLALCAAAEAAEFNTPARFHADVQVGLWSPTTVVASALALNAGSYAASGTWSYAVAPTSALGEATASAVTNVNVSSGQFVRVQWRPVGGALGYRVYRGSEGVLTNYAALGAVTNFEDWGTNAWSVGAPANTATNPPRLYLAADASGALEPVTKRQMESLAELMIGTNLWSRSAALALPTNVVFWPGYQFFTYWSIASDAVSPNFPTNELAQNSLLYIYGTGEIWTTCRLNGDKTWVMDGTSDPATNAYLSAASYAYLYNAGAYPVSVSIPTNYLQDWMTIFSAYDLLYLAAMKAQIADGTFSASLLDGLDSTYFAAASSNAAAYALASAAGSTGTAAYALAAAALPRGDASNQYVQSSALTAQGLYGYYNVTGEVRIVGPLAFGGRALYVSINTNTLGTPDFLRLQYGVADRFYISKDKLWCVLPAEFDSRVEITAASNGGGLTNVNAKTLGSYGASSFVLLSAWQAWQTNAMKWVAAPASNTAAGSVGQVAQSGSNLFVYLPESAKWGRMNMETNW
jgi:hypothetical protein